MPIRLSSIRPENRTIKISELNLHWIGILLLCLSTLSTAVIQRGMPRLDGASPAEMEQIMASGATAQWAVQAMLLTMTATLALPLYAKLLVEAVDQTEDKRRLLLELGGCALASEVPYDWAMSGKLWNGGVQNPAWGLLIGGVMLLFFQRKEGGSQKRDIAAQAVAVAAAAAWTILLRVHLGALLVLLCALLGLTASFLSLYRTSAAVPLIPLDWAADQRDQFLLWAALFALLSLGVWSLPRLRWAAAGTCRRVGAGPLEELARRVRRGLPHGGGGVRAVCPAGGLGGGLCL